MTITESNQELIGTHIFTLTYTVGSVVENVAVSLNLRTCYFTSAGFISAPALEDYQYVVLTGIKTVTLSEFIYKGEPCTPASSEWTYSIKDENDNTPSFIVSVG